MLAMADHADIIHRIHREWEEDAYVLTHTARDFGCAFWRSYCGRPAGIQLFLDGGANNKDDDKSKYSARAVWLMPVT